MLYHFFLLRTNCFRKLVETKLKISKDEVIYCWRVDAVPIELIHLFLKMKGYHSCSDPSWGGRNYILIWVFFVQSILTDRYIHCTELRVVSFKSLSSVEYGIKKIFLNFIFYMELSRFEVLWIIDGFPLFLFTFSRISPKISSVLLKIVKVVNKSTVDFVFRDKQYCWLLWTSG